MHCGYRALEYGLPFKINTGYWTVPVPQAVLTCKSQKALWDPQGPPELAAMKVNVAPAGHPPRQKIEVRWRAPLWPVAKEKVRETTTTKLNTTRTTALVHKAQRSEAREVPSKLDTTAVL